MQIDQPIDGPFAADAADSVNDQRSTPDWHSGPTGATHPYRGKSPAAHAEGRRPHILRDNSTSHDHGPTVVDGGEEDNRQFIMISNPAWPFGGAVPSQHAKSSRSTIAGEHTATRTGGYQQRQ